MIAALLDVERGYYGVAHHGHSNAPLIQNLQERCTLFVDAIELRTHLSPIQDVAVSVDAAMMKS
jgi:hypothetical protein